MSIKTVSSPERYDLLAAALAPLKRGLAVLPLWWVEDGRCACGVATCDHPGKHPLGKLSVHGYKSASKDSKQIERWWAAFPRANVGIATGEISGVVVLDVDPRHGGVESLARLEQEHGKLVETYRVRTGGGGDHHYFRYSDELVATLKKLAGRKKESGLDVQTNGQYVVAPGSNHVSGGRYEVESHPGAAFEPQAFQAPGREPAAAEAPADGDEPITEGRRNETLTSIAGSMRRRGLDQEDIRTALLAHNRKRCEPPLPAREVSAIAASVARYPSADETAEFSDNDLALLFSELHADELRYVDDWGCWMRWQEELWGKDRVLHAFDLAREVCREAATHANSRQAKRRINSASTVAAIERLARCDKRHAATAEQWDADPWLLNTPDATVSLRLAQRGRIELRPHRLEDYLTKIATASPGGSCRRWLQFLNEITTPPGGQPDKELQGFLQRIAGYCLTGSIQEEKLFFLYGTGANGKSVFVSTLAGVLGDYAKTSSAETFMESYTDRHPTELAYLRGARLVTVMELEQGRRWSEAKIKAVTGGDKIPARFMRQDFFEFVPQFKLLISGNHKPSLRSVNEAIRRRLVLIPFLATIPAPKRDPELTEKLKAEWGGILRWAVEGCAEWQRRGLNPPVVVCEATEDYLTSEDTLSLWIEQDCVTDAKVSATVAELYESWRRFCEATGEQPGSGKRFSQNLEARNFRRGRRGGGQRIFWGIGLKCPAYREQM